MLSVEPTSSDRSDSCDNESETETRSESEVEPQPRASAALRARSEGDSETESDSYGGSSNSESVGTGGEGSDLLDVGDVPQPGAKRKSCIMRYLRDAFSRATLLRVNEFDLGTLDQVTMEL
eukprot:gene2672-12775_t